MPIRHHEQVKVVDKFVYLGSREDPHTHEDARFQLMCVLGIRYFHHVTSDEVYEKAGCSIPISAVIRRGMLRLLGHLIDFLLFCVVSTYSSVPLTCVSYYSL